MMEFDEIVVKESPGLCRCCLSEGCYKDMGSEYTWMSENEVYADMLLECFDISISQHNDGPNGPNRLICEVCITRLRDACNFKKQVLDSEKKFVDMIGRGEFRPKVLIYQAHMKAEDVEVPLEEGDVEYLEDEIDFGDDDMQKAADTEPTVSEDITVSTLPRKSKRGRPKKTSTVVKMEKKKAKLEEKAKSSKALVKEPQKAKSQDIRIPTPIDWQKATMRRYMANVLEHSTAIPFKWRSNQYACFYCCASFHEASKLQEHNKSSHININIMKYLHKIDPFIRTKIDISKNTCLKCNETLITFQDLLHHLKNHNIIEDFYDQCFQPFRLNDSQLTCLKCPKSFQFFGTLYSHFNKEHLDGTKRICESCGQHFFSDFSFNKHVKTYHLNTEYKCRYCNEKFSVETSRVSHEFKEHDVKIYKCYKCNEMFGSKYLRKLHMSSIHSTSTFSCEECSKIFIHKWMLLRHVKSLHN